MVAEEESKCNIKKAIERNFVENIKTDTSLIIRWKAMKATIRGVCMQNFVRLKKGKDRKIK